MIICLRPQPDCDADVSALAARNIEAVALPMLTISYHRERPEQLSRAELAASGQGLLITSKQASRWLSAHAEELDYLRRLPVWCVGAGSAESLRQAGFQLAFEGRGSAADLAEEVGRRATASAGPFFWLSGRDIHVDIGACLAQTGIAVDRLIIYQADPVFPSGRPVQDRLDSGGQAAAMVFSARTLIQFDLWLAEQAGITDRSQITILAASPALADQARAAGFKVLQAARPDRTALLGLCRDWADQIIS